MSRQPQLTSLDLWGKYERLCTQLLRDALPALANRSASEDEPALNRALFVAIEDITHKLQQSDEQVPVLIYEGRNPPDPGDSEQTERERKIPDFCWAYYDQYAGRGDFRMSFVVECKRLTQPPGAYTRKYVKSGIARFINVEHSYGHGMASGAMVGYLQEIALDDSLTRVIAVAAEDAIPPLTLGRRDGEASAEFDHDLDRSFPKSPFRLIHIWARIGTWTSHQRRAGALKADEVEEIVAGIMIAIDAEDDQLSPGATPGTRGRRHWPKKEDTCCRDER